jgi:hypothetical protein
VVGGSAEDAQDGVPLELVDQPALALDGLDNHGEEAVEQPDHLIGPGAQHQ